MQPTTEKRAGQKQISMWLPVKLHAAATKGARKMFVPFNLFVRQAIEEKVAKGAK